MNQVFYIFIFSAFLLKGQQSIMYTQYTFNKAGLNPAASGTDITQKYHYLFGVNRQWLGFENAPRSNFVHFSYTIRPPRSYTFWQNAGVYADNEDAGLMGNSGIYLNYAVHTLLRKKIVLSAGLMAGVRRYSRSTFHFDQNDPAVQNSVNNLLLYPDIIPGVRLSNKRFFIGLSMRNLTIFRLQDFKGNKMGSPSLLYPHLYFELGRTIELSEQILFMPSLALNFPVFSPPLADGTLMFYFMNRVGAGVSLRNLSFGSAILQIRFLKSMTLGLAYSYPLNNTRHIAAHSYELMIGITPTGMNTRLLGVNAIVRCPTLTY